MECTKSNSLFNPPLYRLLLNRWLIACWALLLLQFSACGGSSGAESAAAPAPVPTFELSFPPPASRTGAKQLSFRGKTTGNGVASSITLSNDAGSIDLSADAEGSWSGTLPLSDGANNIVATVRTATGESRVEQVAGVLSQLSLEFPQDMLTLGDSTYVLDDGLVVLDLATGVGQEIELPATVSGFGSFSRLHALVDQRLLLTSGIDAVFLNPDTGDVQPIFGDAGSRGALPRGFEYDETAQELIAIFQLGVSVVDVSGALPVTLGSSPSAVFAENLTGNIVGYDSTRRSLVAQTFGFGPNAEFPLRFIDIDNGESTEIALTFNGRPLFANSVFANTDDEFLTLVDGAGQFFSVDPDTGELQQTRALRSVEQAAVLVGIRDAGDHWQALDRTRGRVLRIEKSNGEQSILFDSGIGAGPPLGGWVSGLRLDSVSQRLITTSLLSVHTVAPDTGDRELLANVSPAVTEGIFVVPQGAGTALSISSDGQTAYYVGLGPTREINRVDLQTGAVESIASLEAFETEPFVSPVVAIDAEDRVAYLLDRFIGGEFTRLELDSGSTQSFSAPNLGGLVNGAVWDPRNGRLLVATFGGTQSSGRLLIHSLAPDSGAAAVLLDTPVDGSQTGFGNPIQQLGLSSDSEFLYVALPGEGGVAEVALARGELRRLNETQPLGFVPIALEVTEDGLLFAASQGASVFAINVETGEAVTLSR